METHDKFNKWLWSEFPLGQLQTAVHWDAGNYNGNMLVMVSYQYQTVYVRLFQTITQLRMDFVDSINKT